MQQINLYQSSLKQKKAQLSFQQLLMAMAGVTGLMLVMMVFYSLQVMQLEAKLEAQRVAQLAKLAQLKTLEQQIQARQKDQQLQLKVDALILEISKKQRVMKVLGDQRFGNIDGFSAYVSGLARQRIDGLWLTEIRISHGGETLGVKGQALKAELLPRYLQRLSNESVFTGKAFETLLMSRNQESRGRVDFELYGVGEELYDLKSGKTYATRGNRAVGASR